MCHSSLPMSHSSFPHVSLLTPHVSPPTSHHVSLLTYHMMSHSSHITQHVTLLMFHSTWGVIHGVICEEWDIQRHPMSHSSCLTPHFSLLTPCITPMSHHSGVTPHTPRVHISHQEWDMGCLTPHGVRSEPWYVRRVRVHVSLFTYQTKSETWGVRSETWVRYGVRHDISHLTLTVILHHTPTCLGYLLYYFLTREMLIPNMFCINLQASLIIPV